MLARRLFPLLLISGLVGAGAASTSKGILEKTVKPRIQHPSGERTGGLLKLLDLSPSRESIDFVRRKTQYHLHTLPTEQRHPRTRRLSERLEANIQAGLHLLFSVDEETAPALRELITRLQPLEKAAAAITQALEEGRTIYIFGDGATGRLALQLEAAVWRPFWRNVRDHAGIWAKLRPHLKIPVEDQLIGGIAGGDSALILQPEGFEDLSILGAQQLSDRKIRRGDVIIGLSDDGETSSVLGALEAGLELWKKSGPLRPSQVQQHLFFVCGNPPETLQEYDRSRHVLEEPAITKIFLPGGPQALAGSTRMQAATAMTYVLGQIVQTAVDGMLRRHLSPREMSRLGFDRPFSLKEKLLEFENLLPVLRKAVPDLARICELEAETLASGRYTTYFSQSGLMPTFIDGAERSSTFRTFPLDTTDVTGRLCHIQIWTTAENSGEAWRKLLGRPFRGLPVNTYREIFTKRIQDPFLRARAVAGLETCGSERQNRYDFSFSASNIARRGPGAGDLGIAVLLSPEEDRLDNPESDAGRFLRLFQSSQSRAALLLISRSPFNRIRDLRNRLPGFGPTDKNGFFSVSLPRVHDPLRINEYVALKMILNAHSTAVMTLSGRVTGNILTHLRVSSWKEIGRATSLIQSFVNEITKRSEWLRKYGFRSQISYGEANAVLFETMEFLKREENQSHAIAEAALSIIRILESLRQEKGITSREAFEIVRKIGLNKYLIGILDAASTPQ